MAPRSDISLDPAIILAAAFDVLDSDGLEQLTMRKVADRLSVMPSALYWHYRNKAELLGSMGGAMYRQASSSVHDCTNWSDWLVSFGLTLHSILRSHRDASRLIAVASPDPHPKVGDPGLEMVRPLINLGLSEGRALRYTSSIICLAVGWSTYHDNPAMQVLLGRIMDFDESFKGGLSAMVDGFGRAE